MVVLYVRGRGEGAPCTDEVTVERVEGMPVEELLLAVADKTNIEREELRELGNLYPLLPLSI